MLLEAKDVHKTYDGAAQSIEVLRGASLQIEDRSLTGIYGASGAGKSTLLHILGGLDIPSRGQVSFMGDDIYAMGENSLARMRNRSIGFVFQFYHLLSEFSAVENVMIPCMIAGESRTHAKRLSIEALEKVGLEHRAAHRPAELSGGEQQRVAIARAAVMKPKLILADEPTGNLDRETGERVWEYLLQLNRNDGIGMVVVSHNHELLDQLPYVLELKDGRFGG